MNSSLFYIYYIAFGDCFHLSDHLVKEFPVSQEIVYDKELITLCVMLMEDLGNNSTIKSIKTKDGDEIEYAEFIANKSKYIIDNIDKILAKHFDFTDEELDFIINYDVKYRMGING